MIPDNMQWHFSGIQHDERWYEVFAVPPDRSYVLQTGARSWDEGLAILLGQVGKVPRKRWWHVCKRLPQRVQFSRFALKLPHRWIIRPNGHIRDCSECGLSVLDRL
jgi:hypothetical protein